MTVDAWKENEKVNFEGVFLMRNDLDSFSFFFGARKAMVTRNERVICFVFLWS